MFGILALPIACKSVVDPAGTVSAQFANDEVVVVNGTDKPIYLAVIGRKHAASANKDSGKWVAGEANSVMFPIGNQ